jgi:probable HAF family extracellular repeat protein
VPLSDQLAGVTVVDLGTLPGFLDHSATAVNESGWVVGVAQAAGPISAAFIWKPGVGMSALAPLQGFTTSQAWAINSPGDVAGFSAHGPNDVTPRATLWRAGSVIDLGTLNPASTSNLASRAAGINDAGVVVGTSETGSSAPGSALRLAFRWSQATGMVALFAPAGTRIAEAAAINNAGQIVGYVQPANGPPHAALWVGSSFTDLGVLPGGTESMAAAINQNAVVAGTSTFSSPWNHAFRWTQAGGMTNLGALPGAIPLGPTSEAFGINDAGDVVGRSHFQTGSNPAVLWRGGFIYSLPPLTTGVEVGTARDINNAGLIVGVAEPFNAPPRAVLWTLPSNRPPVADAGGPYQGRKKKEAIEFDGRGSTDPDGDALTYIWNFGDGTPTAAGATPSHVYERLGTYTATLTVSDGRGGSATATATVDILPPGKLDR